MQKEEEEEAEQHPLTDSWFDLTELDFEELQMWKEEHNIHNWTQKDQPEMKKTKKVERMMMHCYCYGILQEWNFHQISFDSSLNAYLHL